MMIKTKRIAQNLKANIFFFQWLKNLINILLLLFFSLYLPMLNALLRLKRYCLLGFSNSLHNIK